MMRIPMPADFRTFINKWTLSFLDKEREEAYRKDILSQVLIYIKIAVGFSIIIYGLFSLLDWFFIPEKAVAFAEIRFIYVIPFSAIVLLFLQFRILMRYISWLLMVVVLASGIGIIVMMALADEELLRFYYVGLILVLIFNYDFLKLRFVFASIAGWAIVGGFWILLLLNNISRDTVLTSSFFLVSANLFGMISSYHLEYTRRKGFFVRQLLLKEQQKSSDANLNLEQKVQERSERLQALNKDLREAEEKYRTMLERSNDIIWTVDIENKISFVNTQFEVVLGYRLEDVVGFDFIRFVSSTYKTLLVDQLHSLEQQHDSDFEIKFRTKLNKEILLKVHAAPLNNQETYNGVVFFGMDITDVQINEVKRQIVHRIVEKLNGPIDLTVLLQSIRFELNQVIDASHFVVVTKQENSTQLKLVYSVNAEGDEIKLFQGKNLFDYIIGEGVSVYGDKKQLLLLDAAGKIDNYDIRTISWMGVPILKEETTIGAILIYSSSVEKAYNQHDLETVEVLSNYISQFLVRQQSDEQLKQALFQATESDRLKSSFLATMSHELRTPLNAIIGFSELINEHTSLEETLDYAKVINDSGNHLLKIVKDVLNITLLESGNIEQTKVRISLGSFINELKDTIVVEQHNTGKQHLNVLWDIPYSLNNHPVDCDEKLLKQVLRNLFKNALKFTLKGNITIGCSLYKEAGKKFIKFWISDTGIGIDPEHQTYIFDLFRQVDDTYTRRFGGIGVGLSTAGKLVALMGGRIWLKSVIDNGSTFYFTIPDVIEQEVKYEELVPIKSRTSAIQSQSKVALIVDDVETSFSLLSLMLKKRSFTCIWAKSGSEAIEICQSGEPPTLVLMDLKMPDMDGYQTTKILKEMYPDLPIVAQTAYAIMGDREKALEAGCDDYISKPIIQQSLIKVLEKFKF